MSYIDKMNTELKELRGKIKALEKSLTTKEFNKLEDYDKNLMRDQLHFMVLYADTLLERIQRGLELENS